MYVLIKLHDVYECIHAFVEGIHHHEYTYADTVMCVYVRRITYIMHMHADVGHVR